MQSGIIFGNRILDVVFVAWFIAQFYKVVSSIFLEQKFNIKRLWETGGMPSSHSSTVSSLTTSVGIAYGMESPLFAIAIVFSGIVMYDAAGIRRAAGKHAGIINTLLDKFASKIGERIHDERLKELLGHTPFEVLAGAALGIVVSLMFTSYIQV
ncbi:divergent PAP2 family protein [Cetobacterium sp. 2A]|uniref:divergent PAP2 family protein n=1 Tax=Cetobacterium sp. 2A TaxID=2754723 RepID=UPI00163CF83C|nr:divergent PAP2 family protein [Cetobacterium sp. 2A]MBC2856084.1 divergent PAP2 family protein [Cetobacterium sp. 2A]